jgi:DNA-binding NtrC family response regulator
MNERVLLIDDEEDFVSILSERLSNRDMNVAVSISAKEGFEKATENNYDAIILDLKMPEMDGIEVLEKIMSEKPEMQVIILSGNATLDKGVKAIKMGALEILEKPVKIDVLVEKIKDAQINKMLLVEQKMADRMKDIMDSKSW